MTLTQRLTEILEHLVDPMELTPRKSVVWKHTSEKIDQAVTAILTAIREDVEGLKYEKTSRDGLNYWDAIEDVLEQLK